jgi:hypothetical protein
VSKLENGSALRQPVGLLEFSGSQQAREPALVYSQLLEADASNRQILKIVGENPGIGSSGLQKKLNFSRAPILSRTKKLDEDSGLLLRKVRPGTEKHSKPALIYYLPPDVTLLAIECAIKGLEMSHYLKLASSEENSLTLTPFTLSQAAQQARANDTPFSKLDGMEKVLKAAVQKIADLEERLNRVEKVLRSQEPLDYEKLLNILHGYGYDETG